MAQTVEQPGRRGRREIACRNRRGPGRLKPWPGTPSRGHVVSRGLDEAKAWGIIAADFAKHVARALHQRYDEPEAETIEKFRRSFLAELEDWTSDVSGG